MIEKELLHWHLILTRITLIERKCRVKSPRTVVSRQLLELHVSWITKLFFYFLRLNVNLRKIKFTWLWKNRITIINLFRDINIVNFKINYFLIFQSIKLYCLSEDIFYTNHLLVRYEIAKSVDTFLHKLVIQNWGFAQNEAQIRRNKNAALLFLFPTICTYDDKS